MTSTIDTLLNTFGGFDIQAELLLAILIIYITNILK